MSHGSDLGIIHDHLGMPKVSADGSPETSVHKIGTKERNPVAGF